MEIEKTVKFKVSNEDDYLEVDREHGTVSGKIADEQVDLTTNKLACQREYLVALSELFTKAAGEFESGGGIRVKPIEKPDDFLEGQRACIRGDKHTGTESEDWVRGYSTQCQNEQNLTAISEQQGRLRQ